MADEPKKNGNENTPPSDGGDGNNNRVEFSDAQQARVNEFIDKAVGRATKSVRQEYETKLNELKDELKEAREALNKAKTPAQRADAKDDIAALQAQIEEMKSVSKTAQQEVERWKNEASSKAREVEAAKRNALEIRKEVAITNAASKLNFVNTEVVLKLTKDFVQVDDETGKFVVVNDAGQPRLNAAMEPMSLDEFYNDFAAKNKYLVRGDVKPGTGSSETMRQSLSKNGKYEVKDIFGPKSNARLANELAKTDPQEYRRLKAIARDSGLVA